MLECANSYRSSENNTTNNTSDTYIQMAVVLLAKGMLIENSAVHVQIRLHSALAKFPERWRIAAVDNLN